MAAVRDPLFDREIWSVLPGAGGSPLARFRDGLGRLRRRLRDSGLSDGHILRLTFFLDAEDPRTYTRLKKSFAAVLADSFGPIPPPASFVGQPPERGRRVALEAAVLSSGAPGVHVERRTLEGLSYTVVEGQDFREVHGAGISAAGPAGDISSQAGGAFARMEAVLVREGLGFRDVVRQWNYIEDIVGVRREDKKLCQNYQAFNDVRSLAYGGSEFAAGYPAATGIGQASGGVVLEFAALAPASGLAVVPLSNPRQVDAHRYSAGVLVGETIAEAGEKTSPKFERAKLVTRGASGIVFVSGTAAVLGQKSVGRRDVEAQTRTTVANIRALTSAANLERAGFSGAADAAPLSYLRAYVKRAADIPKVRGVCERAFGPIPALYVRADVCRPELLVELEGIKILRRALGTS
jgi:enamine deaminase RidA (YjgF/YER057c/UK114 family)